MRLLQLSNTSKLTAHINQLVIIHFCLLLATCGQLKKVQLPAQHGIAMF